MMPANQLPPQIELAAIFDFDPNQGVLFWKPRPDNIAWNKVFSGKPAGCIDSKGYIRIRTNGSVWVAHRVIWKLVHSIEPDFIDHINGIRHDNRIENLRSVTQTENARNTSRKRHNTSGVSGVHWVTKDQRWLATIHDKGKRINLGQYRNFEDAVAARHAGEVKYGYHPNHGR
jgi:hypothetical protein